MDLSSFPPLLIEWFVLTIGIDEGIYSCASLNVHQAWIVRNQLRREMYFNEISKISPFLFFFFNWNQMYDILEIFLLSVEIE